METSELHEVQKRICIPWDIPQVLLPLLGLASIKRLSQSFHNVIRDLIVSENQTALRCHRLGTQKWKYLTLCVTCLCVCALAAWSLTLDICILWLLHADCLGQSWVSCGTCCYFWTPVYIPIIVCVCNLSGKKKQRIKEPPWISMNTFTVIKHSSKIQHQSGRHFPLQSYVLLRASMGLGLTVIFLCD